MDESCLRGLRIGAVQLAARGVQHAGLAARSVRDAREVCGIHAHVSPSLQRQPRSAVSCNAQDSLTSLALASSAMRLVPQGSVATVWANKHRQQPLPQLRACIVLAHLFVLLIAVSTNSSTPLRSC
jgi:hypothetical protein